MKIDAAIGRNESQRSIAKQFAVSDAAVGRHSRACIVSNAAAVQQARKETITRVESERVETEVRSVLSIEDEIQRCFTRMNLIFDACDQWLRDPNDPTRYTIDARSDEVHIVYMAKTADFKWVKKEATLHELLKLAGVSPETWDIKASDPRVLILKTAEQIGRQIDLLAKLRGAYKDIDPAKGSVTIQLTQLIQLYDRYRLEH